MTNPHMAGQQDPTAETSVSPDETQRMQRSDARVDIDADSAHSLMGAGNGAEYRNRWSEIQSRFVDSPKDSVQEADALVAEVMESVSNNFAQTRTELERQWESGEPATDDLRHALQQYRSFFERLLAA